MKTTVVAYIRRKKCGPFTIKQVNWQAHIWAIIQSDESIVWYPSFSGNSKQRRQQRRAMLSELNQ